MDARASSSRRSGRRTTATRSLLSFGQDPRWRAFPRLADPAGRDARARRRDRARPPSRSSSRARPGARSSASTRAPRCSPPARARRARRARRADRAARGRAEALPFADAEFDALTFTYLLRYVDDPAATLRELARVVRPGRRRRDAGVRPAARHLAAALGALRSHRPAGRRRGHRAGLARGRELPRPEHPQLLEGVARAAAPRRVARRGNRRRPRAAAERRRRHRRLGHARGERARAAGVLRACGRAAGATT